ncbi:MAG: RtcB family protein [Chloroflexi bacterium]|nr:RtcB family protein [Chloroflexota bacterium]
MVTTSAVKILRKIDDYHWELPTTYKQGMRVPGLVYATQGMLQQIGQDQALEQVANVAFLPGIVKASLAMPDIHWGYGFAVGGVAATRASDGVISPGGVGFDINCGVRLLRTNLLEEDVRPVLEELVTALYYEVPSGVGSEGKIHLKEAEVDAVMTRGARWAVEHGYGVPEDLEVTEEGGAIRGADPSTVGKRPRERGADQLGTLGSGNHFLEVQAVDEIYQPALAEALGIERVSQVVVMFHCGSRGFGHQVCDDSLRVMDAAVKRYGIQLPDRQLACVPLDSPEGRDYLSAMRCAANFAWANRQCIAHWTREAFSRVLGKPWQALGMGQVYDVAHNIAKVEEHTVDGRKARVCVHRKGATRAFPAGHPELPARYREIGQPVLIPGDMGRYSFLCVAGPRAMEETFGTTCHGAGRTESRSAAKRLMKGQDIQRELAQRGIIVRARGWASLAEEASIAYKDVADVVEVCQQAGLSIKAARMRPLGVIKG